MPIKTVLLLPFFLKDPVGSNHFDCRLEYEVDKQIEKMELVRNFVLELNFNCSDLQIEALVCALLMFLFKCVKNAIVN